MVLSYPRQRVLTPSAMTKLEARLQEFVALEGVEDMGRSQRESLEAEAKLIERQLELVGRYMALAETPAQREATAVVFGERRSQLAAVRLQIGALVPPPVSLDPNLEVATALAGLHRLQEPAELAGAGPAAAGDLFGQIDAKLFLRFNATQRSKHKFSNLSGGVQTLGSASPPGPLYQGPTGRICIKERLAAGELVTAAPVDVPPGNDKPGPEVGWSAHVQHGPKLRVGTSRLCR